MDPVGAALTLVLAGSALYRTVAGKRETLTAGLWTGSLAMGVASLGALLDPDLKGVIGLGIFVTFVVSSYLVARLTYEVADIESHWPIIFTVTSITAMIVLFCVTGLHRPQDLSIETAPGAASAWFAVVVAIGLLPTHISAIIGVFHIMNKDNLLMWLLAVYGGVGALYPILILADHVGTGAVRWQPSVFYPIAWAILLISFGALAVAGVISAARNRQAVPA